MLFQIILIKIALFYFSIMYKFELPRFYRQGYTNHKGSDSNLVIHAHMAFVRDGLILSILNVIYKGKVSVNIRCFVVF